MLFPAAVAIAMRMFVFRDSPYYWRTYRDPARWVLVGFLLLTFLYGVVTLLAILIGGQTSAFQGLGSLLSTIWLLLLFFLYGRSGATAFRRMGLQMGNKDSSLRLVLGAVAFLTLQAGLNLLFGLGRFQGIQEAVYGIGLPAGLYPVGLVLAFLLAVTGVPLSGIAVLFGEEYGWRGFLQEELAPLGRRGSTLLIGAIWGLWHFPLVLSGIHTYPPNLLGLLLILAFAVLVGFVFSYAVLKTGSIWTAAFLHGILNSLHAFFITYIVRPENKVLSFGLGIYGLALLAVVVLLLLRDPVWRGASP